MLFDNTTLMTSSFPQLSVTIPDDFKTIILGKNILPPRPLKVIFSCHEVSTHILSEFRTAKLKSPGRQTQLNAVRDKMPF